MSYGKSFKQKFKKAQEIKSANGWRGILRRLEWIRLKRREAKNYQRWIRVNSLTDEKRNEISVQIGNFLHKPLISVVMPVYNVEEKWLRICIESVTNQIYENWEFCIADDASPAAHIKKVLEEYAAKDERIKIIFRPKNGHISAASNSALELATGEFCVLLDHDDELSEDALFFIAKELNEFPETAMIYSDEDLIDEKGRRFSPKFKPDFSRDLLYSLNLITHLSAYKTKLLRKIGGFRIGAEGSQDYDLALRVLEEIDEKQIRHIPKILYHWRAIRGSVALSGDEKPYAHNRAREAISAHLERFGKRAEVVQTLYNLHRVRYILPEKLPKVSLILMTNSAEEIKNFIAQTDYENLEVIAVSELQITNYKLQILTENLAETLNFAAAKSSGEILCFAEANLKPLEKDWLKELVSFVLQEEIGAVGAKILDADESVLGGAFIVGTDEVISISHKGFPRYESGNVLRNVMPSNFSAVSISAVCVRKNLFDEIGGFDAENLPKQFFDSDFCLKLREKTYRIVNTPYAELIKTDKQKRLNFEENPNASEKDYFVKRWREKIEKDEFYNPNLSKKDASFLIKVDDQS
ncbi:MAG TPA: glycosyltransferase [Pyrinomonadaceae bacterium]|mgnify:CR=1 FL=1|nr:glycosyltransferase [Pyrinomonadaceae bacterium]